MVAQIVGFVAVIISVTIFQFNKRTTMLRLGAVAAFIYSLHFLMLQAYTGSAMNLIGGFRSYIFFKVKPDKRHRWILILFIAIASVSTYLTWQGSVSLLPFIASSLGGIALWHKKPKHIRRWALIVPPIWFTYNLLVVSYPGMVIEIIMFTSNLIGEYRFDIDHKKHMRRKLARAA